MSNGDFLSHPNVQEAMADQDMDATHVTELPDANKIIQDKIMHLFSIYPKISPGMVQVGIGPAIPPAIWRPILERLIDLKVIGRIESTHPTPSGRQQRYTILSLNPQS